MTKLKISLIMTGSNRHEEMNRFFRSLLVQASQNYSLEVVFVNQGSFRPPRSDLSERGIVLREIHTGMLPLSKARNIGLSEARGDLYGFPDDDCWYPEQLLVDVVAYLADRPEVDAICTNVYDPFSKRAYGGRPVGVNCDINLDNLFKLPISVGIFVRRTAFEAAGFYFDERLGAGTPFGSGEETDLIYRLLKYRASVEYVGRIQVFHPVPMYQDEDITKYYKYGLGFGYLNGRIVRDGEWRVLYHLGLVLVRSLGGAFVNLHRSTSRRLYWNRLLGIVQGFVRGVRGVPC